MGHYTLTIQGTGKHHGQVFDAGDADRIARELVEHLERNGHRVHAAVFSHGGGHENLHNPAIVGPLPRGGR